MKQLDNIQQNKTDDWYELVSLRDRPFNLQGGEGGYGVFFHSEFFFRTTRELEYLFFFPEFNIRLYDKNSDFFFLHQNIFSATLGIRIFF